VRYETRYGTRRWFWVWFGGRRRYRWVGGTVVIATTVFLLVGAGHEREEFVFI
jgi:hypothetical protein